MLSEANASFVQLRTVCLSQGQHCGSLWSHRVIHVILSVLRAEVLVLDLLALSQLALRLPRLLITRYSSS